MKLPVVNNALMRIIEEHHGAWGGINTPANQKMLNSVLEEVWSTAIEKMAVLVEDRGKEIGGAIDPRITALCIRICK